jgi:hypothetical protein
MKDERVSLKEYTITQLIDIKESIKIAYASMEKRLDSINEFRETLKDQSAKFLTREEYDAKHQTLQNQLDSMQRVIWTGIGFLLAAQFLLKFFVRG